MDKKGAIYITVLIFIYGNGSAAQETSVQSRRMRERLAEQRPDDGSLVTIHQASRARFTGEDDVSDNAKKPQSSGFSREAMRERLDSIVLLLSRLGDRMVAMETLQNQQTERIDNINYRITKIELQGEETKSQLSEMSSAFRHRLHTMDEETKNTESLLETIKNGVELMATRGEEMKKKFDNMKEKDEKGSDGSGSELRLKAIQAGVLGVKAKTQTIQQSVDRIIQSLTNLTNATTKSFNSLSESLVSKEDLVFNLADLKHELEKPLQRFPFLMSDSRSESKKTKAEAADCWELRHKRGKSHSGVYRIQPPLTYQPFFVYCDMETDGGGWTVVQRREDGSVDFARGWADYKHGFGNLAGEFWIGNEKLFQLTNNQVNELKIILGDFNQQYANATYSAFAIGSEREGYALNLLGAYDGEAGDALSYHEGQKWSTFDMDNDAWPEQNCARDHTGAWWYKACETSNLNGRYLHGPVPPEHAYKGIYWYDYHGPQYSLWQSVMMIRRGGSVKRTKKAPRKLESNNTVYMHGNPDEEPLFVYEY